MVSSYEERDRHWQRAMLLANNGADRVPGIHALHGLGEEIPNTNTKPRANPHSSIEECHGSPHFKILQGCHNLEQPDKNSSGAAVLNSNMSK